VIVVTDTSVVLNLCLIGREYLLPPLFGTIIAPAAVVAEFERLAAADRRFRGLLFPAFIEQSGPEGILPSLLAMSRLQAGEIAALSLAVERKADAVLMDELAGRNAAATLGLRPIGLLGVLLEAKTRALIPALEPLLDRLENEAAFWIRPSLRAHILNAAGEAP
jgi:predicted nucleic acid-binding protein